MAFDIPKDIYPFNGKFIDREGIKQHYLDEGEGDAGFLGGDTGSPAGEISAVVVVAVGTGGPFPPSNNDPEVWGYSWLCAWRQVFWPLRRYVGR